ncbi:MAG: precorrin-6A reductase [Hyphomicrobiales bacterium]|nr:MAG: precorrin-6A reductase [Hyphomicrobiales bacterium]
MTDILLLGGTKMARLLASHLGQKYNVIYSIAGTTKAAKLPTYCQQIAGGFGGADGLADYLKTQNINICIDATHPFAQNISLNAIKACAQAGIAIIQYARKAWDIEAAHIFTTEAELTNALPVNAKILLTIGGQNITPFLTLTQPIIARMIEPPKLDGHPLPAHFNILLSRPPYDLDAEIALMQKYKITHLICKDSGGDTLATKLTAAQQLGIEIYMLARPKSPHNTQLFNICEIETYLNKRLLVSPS